jgi:type IV pilus assembly protein PilE
MTNRAQRMRGVTMIELLTVVAIVGTLSSIAVVSYRSYVLRAHRTDATTALLRIQVAEEKYFLQKNTYTTDLTDIPSATPTSGLGIGTSTQNGFYTLAVAAGTTASIATSYSATATAAGGQRKDTACPTLTIDDSGQHGPAGAAATTCWH